MNFFRTIMAAIQEAGTKAGFLKYVLRNKERQRVKKGTSQDEDFETILEDIRKIFSDHWWVMYNPEKEVFLVGWKKELVVEGLREIPLKDAYSTVMYSGDEEMIAEFMKIKQFRDLVPA